MPCSHIVAVATAILASVAGASAEVSEAAAGTEITVTLPGGAVMEMVWIPPGTFLMGSPGADSTASEMDKPQHQVTLTRGFYLAKYELTQRQYERVTGSDVASGPLVAPDNGPSEPVCLSWRQATALVTRLNESERADVYRLPTEAEWEYACRAGTTTPWFFGDDEALLGDYAWYEDNVLDKKDLSIGTWRLHAVGQKIPNPWNLYDMYGNVAEWCQDFYGPYISSPQVDPVGPMSGDHRVHRGGYCVGHAWNISSAARAAYLCCIEDNSLIGTRLVRQAPEGDRAWGQ